MEKNQCLICGKQGIEKQIDYNLGRVFYVCPICGRYDFSDSDISNLPLDKRKIGAYYFYNRFKDKIPFQSEYRYHTTLQKEKCDEYVEEFKNGNIRYGHPVHIDNDMINAWYPTSFAEQIDKILLKLEEMTEYLGQAVILSRYELYGLFFVERYKINDEKFNEDEMNKQVEFYESYLKENNYISQKSSITSDDGGKIYLTANAYNRIDQLQKNIGDGRDVLVAMKFGDDTKNLREAVKSGIRDAGYNPILIDEVEHNELITPELLNYIKKSRFVVVDLTHQNNGAYFEEGYAMGLGKPVIQLCQKDTKLHFDVAQKNTIMWENEDDIPLRLKNRIKATID